MKKSVGIIFGGCSSEYPVSLASSYSVIKNLDEEKYEKHLIGITQEGGWYYFDGDIEDIKNDTWMTSNSRKAFISPDREKKGLWIIDNNHSSCEFIKLDVVFPVLHGKNGEDGTVQGLLQLAGIPLVGCGLESSVLCMDKYVAHRIAHDVGVKTPKNFIIMNWENPQDYIEDADEIGYPLFVKPIKGGSSLGITKVHNKEELIPAIELAFKYDNQVICEENIHGFEVGCAVIGNEEIRVSPVDEIELFVDWFDFGEKYSQHKSKIHMPARISEDLSEKIRETAAIMYRALSCESYARVDIFIKEGEQGNEILFNEINTIPGLTDVSRFPNMVKAMGISYKDLLDMLIEFAK
ncbi:D-alanine--D-serine ligase VanG [Eubacteriales bacterium KG127]